MRLNELFRKFAERTAQFVGSPWAFVAALVIVFAWAGLGPVFRYSDTWQLVINTGTTIVTFLIVFLIQNTQNRETRIVRLKIDELLRAVEGARTGFVSLDRMSDAELEEVQKEFERLEPRYAPLVNDDLEAVRAEREWRSKRRPATS
jgi:low affinity Fe/Cu permease